MENLFGQDPEFMLIHKKQLKSAIGILPPKEKPISKFGHKFYYDNVLAEIAIKPGKSKEEVLENTRTALLHLSKISKFEIRASANYPKSELLSDESRIVSCIPEYNVYTLEINNLPKNIVEKKGEYYYFNVPLRTCGGHIHLGVQQDFNIIRMMDLFIGIPSLFLDVDKNRRKAYGLAGSFRMPKHGLEYRTLSNFWLASPKLVSLVYDLCEFVINFVEKKHHERFWATDEELIYGENPSLAYNCFGYDAKILQKCINTCDKKMAEKFMIFISNYLPAQILNDFEKLIGLSLDPYKEWKIC